MTRRLEAGPLLVTLGALLLLVSLFSSWYGGDISAWEAFEVWDVVLFVLALGSIAAGLGLATQGDDFVERRYLPAAAVAVAAIVASQIIDPPPAAAGQDPDTGAWLALGAALVMCVGAVLTVGRVRLALTIEGRDRRRHVPAVDARRPEEPTTESHEVVARAPERQRLFARDVAHGREQPEQREEPEPTGARTGDTGTTARLRPKGRGGKPAAEEKQD
jgi:hypothetical protein